MHTRVRQPGLGLFGSYDLPFVRLDMKFDARALLREAFALDDKTWQAHFNTQYHSGGWQGIALRSVSGEVGRLFGDSVGGGSFANTPTMAAVTQIQKALSQFQCPLRMVRLLRLTPGASIREHRDDDLRFDRGEARLHIPLLTHPSVEFYIEDERVMMEAGECWFLDLARPHRVWNGSPVDRVHLVIDCEVNDWLRERIANGDAPKRAATTPSRMEQYQAFRALVWRDQALQAVLSAIDERPRFLNEVVRLGKESGFQFGVDDVDAAMMRSRQEWMSQWMV